MITKEVIVLDIKKTDNPREYALELTIDGVYNVFLYSVPVNSEIIINTDINFERVLVKYFGARELGKIAIDFHQGKDVSFPQSLQLYQLAKGEQPPPRRK